MSRLTHGGLQEVWVWDERTYKLIGEALFYLCSGDPKKRQKGYNLYYDLKRHFYPEIFEKYIDDLDNFRSYRGVKTMRELVEVASREVVKQVPEDVPYSPPVMPPVKNEGVIILKQNISAKPSLREEGEQLSLF